MGKILLLLSLALSAVSALGQANARFTANLTAASGGGVPAANSSLQVSSANYSIASVTVSGTYAASTLVFEFSDDGGTTWYPLTCTRTDAAIQENSEAVTDNATRAWDCSVYATQNFRVRQSAITSGTVKLAITLSSAPIEAAPTVSLAAGTSSIGAVLPLAGTATDKSGSIASGATSQTLAAANVNRRRIIIQNPCNANDQGIAAAENLYINFTSAATVGGTNSFALAPCGSFDSGSGPVTTELITVISTTVSHKYVAKEL